MNKKKINKNLLVILQKGFSLVELLVVVAIIGVLAGIGIVGYNSYIEYAVDKVNEANAKLLADAINNERIAQRGRLKSNCSENIKGTTDGSYSILFADNLPSCINNLVINNQITNPFTNKTYGAQYNGWYSLWSYTTTLYDDVNWDNNFSDLKNNDYIDRGYAVSGSCSDDVGGLAIVYTGDWSTDPVKFKGYVATCKTKRISSEWGDYDTPYGYKFFTFE